MNNIKVTLSSKILIKKMMNKMKIAKRKKKIINNKKEKMARKKKKYKIKKMIQIWKTHQKEKKR